MTEMGDNLHDTILFLQKWFKENNVEVPKTAREWTARRVGKGDIPSGYTYHQFQKRGISVAKLINMITGSNTAKIVVTDPITKDNILDRLGLYFIKEKWSKTKHKVMTVKCSCCQYVEDLDYGTLKRMYSRGDKLCRICRNVGGKEKPLELYDRFDGFTILSKGADISTYKYQCDSCKEVITRTSTHVLTAEYLVCPKCTTSTIFGSRIEDPIYGAFHSKIEYCAFKLIKSILPVDTTIERQIPYKVLYGTNTQHTADFFIPKYSLVLEITTPDFATKVDKYKDTKAWKKSFGAKFATTLLQVEDIVRQAMKVA